MYWFFAHFMALSNVGPGDSTMSSLFQAQLSGNNFDQNPLEIAYQSVITLKNNAFNGGLLHSHSHLYPSGSKQQQVTGYHFRDDNNNWRIVKPHGQNASRTAGPVQYVQDGDMVRLVHEQTHCFLHSHPVHAAMTPSEYEVSCYGNGNPETGYGDMNDNWRIAIADDVVHTVKDLEGRIHSLTTRIQFQHVQTGCILRSHNTLYPEWGYRQLEVVCDRHQRSDSNNLWNVETHKNPDRT